MRTIQTAAIWLAMLLAAASVPWIGTAIEGAKAWLWRTWPTTHHVYLDRNAKRREPVPGLDARPQSRPGSSVPVPVRQPAGGNSSRPAPIALRRPGG